MLSLTEAFEDVKIMKSESPVWVIPLVLKRENPFLQM